MNIYYFQNMWKSFGQGTLQQGQPCGIMGDYWFVCQSQKQRHTHKSKKGDSVAICLQMLFQNKRKWNEESRIMDLDRVFPGQMFRDRDQTSSLCARTNQNFSVRLAKLSMKTNTFSCAVLSGVTIELFLLLPKTQILAASYDIKMN